MRILIIEDDSDLAQFIRKGLQEEGYAIDQATNGEDGFLFASTYSYDLLLLDVMLPQLDGHGIVSPASDQGIHDSHPLSHGSRFHSG